VKSKNGQVLILTLIIMAIGLIVISPLLSYLQSSQKMYTSKLIDSAGYLTADAMMSKIFSDMWAAENIYELNISESENYNNQSESGWLNGFSISTSIDNSINNSPPPSGTAGWVYLDPAISFGLDTLENGDTHVYEAYLTENTSVTVNWYFKDAKRTSSCNYYCNGSMWISDGSGTVCGSDSVVLTNGSSTAFQQQLTWTVPSGGTGNYFFNFENLATRTYGSGCPSTEYRDMSDFDAESVPPGVPTFSGIGE